MKSLPHNSSSTGAGERVRGWVKTEMDVVVSAKEAEQARQQLIKERKTLAEEIQKLKVECRRTMAHQETTRAAGLDPLADKDDKEGLDDHDCFAWDGSGNE